MQTTGTRSTPPDGCLAHLTRVIKSFLWKTWLQRGDRTTRPLEWSETSLPPSPINHLGITPTPHPSPNLRALLHLSRGQQTHPSPAERHMSAARTSRLLPRSSFPAPRQWATDQPRLDNGPQVGAPSHTTPGVYEVLTCLFFVAYRLLGALHARQNVRCCRSYNHAA